MFSFKRHSGLNRFINFSISQFARHRPTGENASRPLSLTFARAKTFAGDVDGSAMNAVVVFETARRAVRAIVVSAKERRLHHGTFLAPVTREKTGRMV